MLDIEAVVFFYLLVGAIAGLSAGLLGIGGGLVIVPALLYIFSLQGFPTNHLMHLAVGSSLTTIIFTSLASTYGHHRKGAVQWPIFRPLALGLLVGAGLGAMLAEQLPSHSLQMLFGIFEIGVAIQMLSQRATAVHRNLPKAGILVALGGVIGSLSALLGIGGGTLTVPALLWCNIEIRKAVATAAAGGLPIALTGALGFLLSGWGNAELPQSTTGFVYWPAVLAIVLASLSTVPLGVYLAHRLPSHILRPLFAFCLLGIGGNIFWNAR